MNGRRIEVTPDDILSDPAFVYFRKKHGLRESTLKGYIQAFQRYVEYTGCSLTELAQEAEREETDRIPLEKRKIGERMRGFRKHMKEQKLAPSSVKRAIAGVKSFYVNGYSIMVPKLGRDLDLTTGVLRENKGLPDRQEILQALSVADLRETAIILAITSSGLPAADLLRLTIEDFRKGYDKETGVTILDMRRMKTARDFVTFFSAEATTAINEYLVWRERPKPKTCHGDILNGWTKHRIYSEKDYLFVKKFIPDLYLDTHDDELRREDEDGIQTVFRHIVNRAGIARGKGLWNMFRAHKLRAWFFSMLINNKCPLEHAEIFMGHSSRMGSSNGTYYSLNIQNLKETYLQYMPFLSLKSPLEVRVIQSTGYQALKAENEELRQQIEELRKERGDVDSILDTMFRRLETDETMKQRMIEFLRSNKVYSNKKL